LSRHDHIPLLILVGRPGAGKSEVINYLKHEREARRRERFHIGPFLEVDDFPMLWTWFEEDQILSEMGHERLHSDAEGYFLHHDLWNLLIRRLELEYKKLLADQPALTESHTVIVEFSRGSEHGGFREAFSHFSQDFLSDAAVLYIDVSFEESLRKNRSRFNPDKPHSILEHGLPNDKLERLYGESDWTNFSSADPQFLTIDEARVPYVVFPNEDDVTTPGGAPLGDRLADRLGRLADIRARR
jgi:tRNA uridine 5-carbamoylmethylation protein Kti12